MRGYIGVRYLALLTTLTVFLTGSVRLGYCDQSPGQTPGSGPASPSKAEGEGFELDDSKGHTIPFNYAPPDQPYIVIQAHINKSKAYNFVVSTASGVGLSICTWAQKELNLPLTGQTAKFQPGNQDVPITKACDVQLVGKNANNDLNFSLHDAVILDSPILENYCPIRVAGIIGVNLFQAVTTRFDFDKQALTIFTQKHPPLKPSGPFTNVPILPIKELQPLQIHLTVPGMDSVPFNVDTGSTNTDLLSQGTNKLTALAVRSGGHIDISGDHPGVTMLLPELMLETRKLPMVSVTVLPNAVFSVFSLDLFSCFRVTIDPDNLIMTFEPRKGFRYRRDGDPGIRLGWDGKTLLVDKITRSEAFDAGVALNDHVLSIDGQSLANLTPYEASARLGGYEGTTAKVLIEKPDGKQMTVELSRRSLFPTVIVGIEGMTLLKEDKQPARVLEIVPDSTADRMGLQIGDEILAINDEPIVQKTVDQIAKQYQNGDSKTGSVKTVQVKRKADGKTVTLSSNIVKK